MVCIINRSYDTSLFKFQKQSEWFCILMGIILTPRYSSIFAKSYNHVGQYQSLLCFTFDATNHSLAVRFPSLWLLAENPPMYCYVHPALLRHVSDTYADSVCVCQFCHFYLPQSDIHFNWIQFNSHPWVSGVVQDRKSTVWKNTEYVMVECGVTFPWIAFSLWFSVLTRILSKMLIDGYSYIH